jgi:hypothetical protein
MQYYLCPRCQFRIAANKHVCATCGLNIASQKSTASGAENNGDQKASKSNLFSKFLKMDRRPKEATQEKPALG